MKAILQLLSIVAILNSIVLLRDHPSTVSAQSADETALRAIVQRYVDVYAKEDIIAMMSLWSMRSRDVRQRLESLLESFTAADRVFSSVNVSGISVEGNRAVLLLSADLSVRSATGQSSNEPFSRKLALVKEAGTWKIWWDLPASQEVEDFLKKGADWKSSTTLPLEEQFATALLEVTADDQRALLTENREMLTPELQKTLLKKAASLQSMRLFPKAIEAYRVMQRVAEIMGDKPGIALAHLGIAGLNRELGSLSQALDGYQRAFTIFEGLGDKVQVGAVWMEIGKTRLLQRDHVKALESYNNALAVFDGLNDRAKVADTLDQIGGIHYTQGKHSEAISVFEKSLRLNEILGRKAEVAATSKKIGNARYHREDYEGAIEFYLKALTGFEALKNASAISETMRHLGGASFTLGNYDSALEYYRKALVIEEGMEDRRGMAASLFGLGSSTYALGDFAAALDHFYRNLELLESLFEKADIPETLRRIGLAHLRLRSYDHALTAYQRCLSLFQERSDKLNAAVLMVEIGNIEFLRRSYDAAIDRYRAALSDFESLHNMVGVASCYGGIGAAYSAKRLYDSALEFYQKSLPIFERLGDKEQVAGTLESIAGVYHARTDYAKSLEFADRAAATARQAKSQQVLWQARFTAGSAHRSLNQPNEARLAFSESIATVEAIRAQLTADEQSQPFFRDKNHPYIALMELLLEQSDTLGALTLAERVKSHILWDMLRPVKLRITRGMSAREQNQERQLSNRLVYLARRFERDKQMSNPVVSLSRQLERNKEQQQRSDRRLAELEAGVRQARQDYEVFLRRLYAAHPRLMSLRGEAPALKAEEAGRVLDADTALLSFVVTDERTCLFVFTRGRPGARPAPIDLKAYVIGVSRDALAGSVTRFRTLIAQRSADVQPAARELFNLLLGPASVQLSGKTQLIIAPESVLWDLPFQALQPSDGRYLIEDHAVSYVPSLTAFREMNRTLLPRMASARMLQMLAFGDPQLAQETLARVGRLSEGGKLAPDTSVEGELKSLAQIYGSQEARAYTGADASEERMKVQTGRNRILQLSLRTILSDTSPLHSPALMAATESIRKEDGLLHPWEIAGLNLRNDVVVMSGCEPATSGAVGGEAATGLAWAWLATGTPTVIMNQGRPEPDEAGFLPELHRNLRQTTPSEALRRSSLKMLKGHYSDPFYWSRFIILGKGK